MADAVKRLMTLQVNDVMNRSVVHVSTSETMSDVADKLIANDVSGVPVVDDDGQCIGMLSAASFVRRDQHAVATLSSAPAVDLAWNHMSESVQSIDESATLLAAARIMSAQHVHRLPVLDSEGRPIGMLTSTDIIAVIINVVDEMEAQDQA